MLGQLVRFVVTGGFVTALGVGVYALVALGAALAPAARQFPRLCGRGGDRLCHAQPVELPRPWRRADAARPSSRFVIVSLISYALNSFWVWLLYQPARPRPRRADPADAVRDPGRDLRPQPPVGFPLMERIVYDQMAELDQRHWWYRRAARGARRADPPRRSGRRRMRAILEIGCGTGHNLAMLGRVRRGRCARARRRRRARSPSKRLGKPVHGAPLPELDGVAERPLRPDRARST